MIEEMDAMKESVFKSYDELPLFFKTRAPAGTQRSGSGGKRRRSGMDEFSLLGGNEGYEACADEVPKEKFREWVERNTGGSN